MQIPTAFKSLLIKCLLGSFRAYAQYIKRELSDGHKHLIIYVRLAVALYRQYSWMDIFSFMLYAYVLYIA